MDFTFRHQILRLDRIDHQPRATIAADLLIIVIHHRTIGGQLHVGLAAEGLRDHWIVAPFEPDARRWKAFGKLHVTMERWQIHDVVGHDEGFDLGARRDGSRVA